MAKKHKKEHRKPHKKHKTVKKHLHWDTCFALLVSLAVIGVLTLVNAAKGIYIHLNNTATLSVFIFAALLLIKYTHGLGKNQAFYSAFLASFGYFLFYRIYNYILFNDFWKMSPIVGDSLVCTVINLVIIYIVYSLFMYFACLFF